MELRKFFDYSKPVAFLLLMSVSYCAKAQTSYPQNTKINFIRVWEAKAPEQDPAILTTRPLRDVLQTTEYLDGLGRSLQTVVKKGSMISGSAPIDLVKPVLYDEFGREQFKYLPFAANNAGGNQSLNDGLFKLNPFQQQPVFAAVQYPGESHYYEKTDFEASPLKRNVKVMAPGASWAGAGKGVETKYWVNTESDSVRIWDVNNNPGALGTYVSPGRFAPGQLFKTVAIDEHQQQIIEFKDKDGNIVLKKSQMGSLADNGGGKGHDGWLCTYFIYDNAGDLRCVIPPVAVKALNNSWTFSQSLLDEQCFRYEYDERRRQVIRKLPGAGEIRVVYDQWDREVLRQDGNLRTQNRWLFTKYDQLNRHVLTGYYTNATYTTQATMQSFVDAQNLARYEVYNPAQFPTYSLNQTFPATTTFGEVLSLTYYDDYSWKNWYGGGTIYASKDNSYDNRFTAPTNTWPYAEPLTQAGAIGLVTGVWDKTGLITASYYDGKGRVIQTKSYNLSTGIDIETIQYDFSGKVLQKVMRHQKGGTNTQIHELITKMKYDSLGRMINVRASVKSTVGGKQINMPERDIVNLQYDAIGQISSKVFDSSAIETQAFEYNIRGWILGMNRNYVKSLGNAAFGYELGYDRTTPATGNQNYLPQFNGNVSGNIWKSMGDQVLRRYDFRYDQMNRLSDAHFTQLDGGTFNTSRGIDFSTTGLKYDGNGNILSMSQRGWKLGGSSLIDSLQYNYFENSNKLKNIIDKVNDTATGLGDFRSSKRYMKILSQNKTVAATDYNYDASGNLNRDLNKDIGTTVAAGVVYDYHNLPLSIGIRDSNGVVNGSITYVYDAEGNKLKKTIQETGKPLKVTLYLGDFVYENDTLQFVSHPDGRFRFHKQFDANGDSSFVFMKDYFLKDHLDNVRMVLTTQRDTARYFASMESAFRSTEEKIFNKIPETAAPIPAGYPAAAKVTNPDDFAAKLNGNNNKVGPSIVLKVMSGDTLDFGVKYYYQQQSTQGGNGDPASDLVTMLASGIIGQAGGAAKGTIGQLEAGNGPLAGMIDLFRNRKNADRPNKPRAYLNYILFDEQFQYDSVRSGAKPVDQPNDAFALSDRVEVKKNGFIYIYVSNETKDWDVYFNDLSIQHFTGPVLEENHYYPFGLTMAGISSRAFGKLENRNRFNGIEQTTEFDINMYDAFYRNLDPQVGRWWQIDPKPTESESPYALSKNNPVRYKDPKGDTIAFPGASKDFIQSVALVRFWLSSFGGPDYLQKIDDSKTLHISIVQINDEDNRYDPDSKTIYWNPNMAMVTEDDVSLSPATQLSHEADHAFRDLTDKKNFDKDRKYTVWHRLVTGYDSPEEQRVIQGSEQGAAFAMGDVKPGQITRTNHRAKGFLITTSPLSNKGVEYKPPPVSNGGWADKKRNNGNNTASHR